MHWIFLSKRPALDIPVFPIERIAVASSIYHSQTDYDLPLYVGDFVQTALDEEWYLASELPKGTEAFRNLWNYHGEVQGNGHAYLGCNMGSDFDAWRRASGMLGTLGLNDHRDNLDAFIAFEIEHGATLDGEDDLPEDWHEPYYRFDDRYRALESAGPGMNAVLRDWLKAQPWVIEVPTLPNLYQERSAIIPAHPLREARREYWRAMARPDVESSVQLLAEILRKPK